MAYSTVQTVILELVTSEYSLPSQFDCFILDINIQQNTERLLEENGLGVVDCIDWSTDRYYSYARIHLHAQKTRSPCAATWFCQCPLCINERETIATLYRRQTDWKELEFIYHFN